MSGLVSILPILQCKLHEKVGLHLQALTRLWALGLRKVPPSLRIHGLIIFMKLIRLLLAGLRPVMSVVFFSGNVWHPKRKAHVTLAATVGDT